MPTSLAQLLDTLGDAARSTGDSPAAHADAATALGHLGRALNRLRIDGVSTSVGDRRERQVTGLATACTELAARAPLTEDRLTQLAAAAADLTGILRQQFTNASRWAAVVEITDVVAPLGEVVGRGLEAGPAARWLEVVQRSAVLVEQAATQHPPSRVGAALLDYPIPGGPVTAAFEPAAVVAEAVAVLLQATARPADPPAIAEVLAFTVAAQTLSRAAGRLPPAQHAQSATNAEAAGSWQAVRAALRPFGDGSRRRHPHAPPAVQAAGRLHTALHRDTPDPATWSGPLRGAVAAAAQHLPELAIQLDRTVASWARTGALLAYASDLQPRDGRVAQQLRGHRLGGLIQVDATDLRPVQNALNNARLLSTAVAAQAIDPSAPAAATFPRRMWAVNRASLDHPHIDADLRRATEQAQAYLAATPNRPTAPRRTR